MATTKSKMAYVIAKLKEISGINHVDAYYQQDENLGNVTKFPAVLVGFAGCDFNKESQYGYNPKIKLGLMLFVSAVKPSLNKEYEVLDLIDSIYNKFEKDYQVELLTVTALERTSSLSLYYIEISVNKED